MVEMFDRMGVSLHFVVEGIDLSTANGKLMANLIMSAAQHYSDILSERVREAKAIKRLTGKVDKHAERVRWEAGEVRFKEKIDEREPTLPPGVIRLYARCSTHDQELSGLGMEVQVDGILSYARRLAEKHGCLAIKEEVYSDPSISAFKTPLGDRPSGKQMLEDARPGDHIVLYRADRGFRNGAEAAKIIEELKSRNIFVHLVDTGIDTSTPMGAMWVSIMCFFASMESQVKSHRFKAMHAELRRQGRPVNNKVPCQLRVEQDPTTQKKRLVVDKNKTAHLCMVHILDLLGFSADDICDIVYARLCKDFKLKAQRHKCRWNHPVKKEKNFREMVMTREYLSRLETIPPRLLRRAYDRAIEILQNDIPIRYKRFCRCPYPVDRIRDRLAAVGIHAPLDELSPSLVPTSTF